MGEGKRLRRVDEMEEADKRPALWSQPNSESSLHALVVANYKQSQRLRRLPGPARLDWHFYARQNTNAKNLAHSNISRPFVAKDSRVRGDGLVSSV